MALDTTREMKNSVADTWTPSKYDVIPSLSKSERNIPPHVPTQNKEDLKTSEINQGVNPTPRINFRKETSSRRNQVSMCENNFNGCCYSCNNFGHKASD